MRHFFAEIFAVQVRYFVLAKGRLEFLASRLEFIYFSVSHFDVALHRLNRFLLVNDERLSLFVLVSDGEKLVHRLRRFVSRRRSALLFGVELAL